MGDESEWAKLPTDEKIQHKAWKARVSGYEEATKMFPTLEEKSPEFLKYLGLIKKMVIDSNAIAQEKALDAVLAFVTNAHVAGRTTSEACSGVITKCLNSARTKTKENGLEILMMYIEIEKQEIVQEELMKGLTNKQPKVVVGCIQALRQALSEFGMKTITIKPMVKQLQRLLEDRDKNVREETKLLAIEIYRWIGQALKPQLANLKPVQVAELEAEFDKLPPGKPQQTRFLRSQQDLKVKMEEAAAAGGEEEEEGDACDAGAEIDPYEMMDAVDILPKIPKDYYDKIESKKWQERREALEAIEKLVQSPKIEGGDFNDLVRTLRKVIAKDSNVMLVTLGGKVLLGLAVGLRKKFSPHSVGCIETILDKFKEKKPTVVAVLRDAIDACFTSITLDPISEQCVASLDNKNPSIKAETARFLSRCFCKCTMATLPKKLLKMFVAQLLKTINDTAPDVREASFEALGTAMKVVGEKPIMPFLADVDNLKMTKIKECCEKAVVAGKPGKAPAASAGAPATAPAPAAPAAKAKPAAAKKEPAKSIRGGGGGPSKGGAKSGGKSAGGAKGKKGGASSPSEEASENLLSDDALEDKWATTLPAEVVTSLASSNWKERLASMEKFTDIVKSMARSDISCQAYVRLITRKPGLKENNFQVLKLKVNLIGHLAQNANFSKRSAEFCLTELVDKIGDVKNGSSVMETLSCISEACGLDWVSLQVICAAFEQKNPKNQAESLNWLTNAIKEFGFKINIKPMMKIIKKAFTATAPAIRTANIGLLGVMYMHMGPTLRVFFEDEKPALLQQIDAEFERVKGEKLPAPIRGAKAASEEEEEEGEEDDEADGPEGINVADLVPRNNISGSITPELLTEMGDKNWKIRAEALQKLTTILNDAKFITPNIGGLPEALKARLGDSNKILVNTTVTIAQTLASAMGPKINQHVRVIGPGIITVFGDAKPHVRAAAVSAANVWVEQCGLLPFVEAEIFSDALALQNPLLRAELLGWLAEKLPNCKKLPAELNMCTPHIFSSLEDRNATVRQKAQDILVPYIVHVGYESVVRQASKLKPASKDVVMGHLEKAKANLPAKPVKQKATKGPAKTRASPEPEPEPACEDYDEPAPASSAPAAKETKGAAKGRSRTSVLGKKAGATTSRKKEEEVDTSPPLKVSNGKDQRMKDERNLKVLKWNFVQPRGEFVEQLKTQMEPTFSKTLMDQLYHSDFKKLINGIDTFIKVLESDPDAVIANLDLILRWITLRFFETNTSVLLKALEFLQLLFNNLAEQDYHMTEYEAGAFIPYLITKVGDPKDNVRRDIRSIFKLVCKVYPSSKMFSLILEGLKTKNTKQKMECLEELGCLIEMYGINVCQPSPAQALKLIATHIGTRDNSVRSAALNTVVAAYTILGEAVYKYVGNLSDKDMGMLEERIKRSSKTRPATAPPPQVEERPNHAAARPLSANAQQLNKNQQNRDIAPLAKATKKAYQLNLSEDEDPDPEDYELPKLIEHDIDDILYDPIKIPTFKSRLRPPSPSMKLLSGSCDAKAAIDLTISQIASNDVETLVGALTQIDEVLKNKDMSDMMASHIDQYLVVCVVQLRMTHGKHIADDGSEKDIVRIYRCVLGSLLSMFRCKALATSASSGVLKDLFHILITILLDQRLMDLDEGPQIVRSVNVMMVNIVQRSDNTAAMCALLRLLHESVALETCPAQFLELIMKCLWKLMRNLPDIVNDLNLDRVLLDIHNFLKAFPSHTWRSRPSDVPIRTIRTILHTLAKLLGNKVMSHLTLIEQSQNSEVEHYLQKVLKTGFDKNSLANNAKNDAINGNEENLTNNVPKERSTKRLSKTTHDMLAEIFKKIGSKENTREGLNDLYEFKKTYPDADLDPFLKKSSQFFQNYITRGLKSIELEREGTLKQSSSSNKMTPSSSSGSISGGQALQAPVGEVDPAVYRARLKVLRARLGLDNKQPSTENEVDNESPPPMGAPTGFALGESDPSSLSSSSSSGIAQTGGSMKKPEETEEATDKPTVNLVDLRKRLERIRNATAANN